MHAKEEPAIAEQNHNEHWANTVRSLDLRGYLLAGMAVFLAYFEIRKREWPLPEWFLLNPYLSAACFVVVVSRSHLMGSIEPEMAAWWDRTIGNTGRRYRVVDYALEGPWLFLLMSMPFSCISVVTFGLTYATWSTLEMLYLFIGRHAVGVTNVDALGKEVVDSLRRYYNVRIQGEAVSTILTLASAILGGLAAQSGDLQPVLTAWCWVCIIGLLLQITLVEVMRNPWFLGNFQSTEHTKKVTL